MSKHNVVLKFMKRKLDGMVLNTYVVLYNALYLEVERTVQCSRTVWFFGMFGRFDVRFWARLRCSKVFEVRS